MKLSSCSGRWSSLRRNRAGSSRADSSRMDSRVQAGSLRDNPVRSNREHLRKAVEGSLKRLRVDRIDVYQLHVPDPVIPFEASVQTLAQLRNEGKIRLVALSNVTQEHIERARKIVPIVSVQNRYSFADREWDYVVDYCERNGIAFIPWFPLGAGKVAGEVLNRIAQARNASPTQVALAWLLHRSPVILPIPGTTSVEHLEENVAASAVKLSDAEWKAIEAAAK